MGFEVELKFRVDDLAGLARRLADRGASAAEAVDHEDVYFAHPSRDFAASGEAFRVRGEGDANRVTYKGPKHDGPTKTREEIELGFDPGLAARADLQLVLERLGFRPVLAVRKRRTSHELVAADGRPMTVVLDRVEGLGDYAEVETLAAAEADLAAGQGAVLALARELGLGEPEPRSYLRMLLEAAGRI